MGFLFGCSCVYKILVQYNTLKLILNSDLAKNLFAHNLFLSCSIVLIFCTEHGSDTAVLWAKYQKDWATEMAVMEKMISWDLSLRWVSEGYPILHWLPAMQWWKQNLGQTFDSQKTPVIFPHEWTMGCLLWVFWRKLTLSSQQHTIFLE